MVEIEEIPLKNIFSEKLYIIIIFLVAYIALYFLLYIYKSTELFTYE